MAARFSEASDVWLPKVDQLVTGRGLLRA